jgi:hypothetical protein
MSEQVHEQTPPTKEELMQFFQEQIDVKKVQLELQELNTKLAVARAEELKALSFVAQITNPQQQTPPQGTVPHTITQEDLDANPELVDAGVKLGDEVLIPGPKEEAAEKPSRKLKTSK